MSRIDRLARPMREPFNRKAALAVLGLVVACGALYSALQAPVLAATPQPQRAASHWESDGEGYAIVRANDKGDHIAVRRADRDELEAARRVVKGDFIWLRHDGKPYVIEDAKLVARAIEAWAPMEALGKEMEGHGSKMAQHGKQMEALGKKMASAALAGSRPGREQELAFRERIHELSGQRADLARQAAHARHEIDVREGLDRSKQKAALEAIRLKEEAIEAQIEAESEAFAAKHMSAQGEMEAVGREMEAAGKPMEALGEQMEALGERMERQGEIADKATRALIDDALRSGKARPAPHG